MSVIVSHATADEPWAQWIALVLRAGGHEVRLDPADSSFAQRLTGGPGSGLGSADPVLILLSAEHRATTADWAQLRRAPTLVGRLIAVRLDAVDAPRTLRAIPCRSLHGLDEEDAVEVLLTLVGGIHRRHLGAPDPPSASGR